MTKHQHTDTGGRPTQRPEFAHQDILRKLLLMIGERLFARDQWWPDKIDATEIYAEILRLGLEVQVDSETSRTTQLGEQVNLDLIMLLLGVLDEGDIPILLKKHGFIDAEELQLLFDMLERGETPESIFRPYAMEVYFAFTRMSRRIH